MTCSNLYSQNISVKKNLNNDEIASVKNLIGLNLRGISPVYGVSYERIITPLIGIQVGAGFPSIGIGAKIYPLNFEKHRMKFFVGITFINFFATDIIGPGGLITYLPIGFNYVKKNKIFFGIKVGPALWNNYIYSVPYAGFHLGKAF